MAIEPIKGFYVHDEVTDTDGVARYDAEQLAGDVPEVADLRIGYDGTTYPSAGDAVREQIADINNGLSSFTNYSYEDKSTINVTWQTGGYYRISDGGFIEDSTFSYAEIALDENEKYIHFIGTPLYYACGLIFMNGDTKIGESVPANSSTTPINNTYMVPYGATSIRISKRDNLCSVSYASIILEPKDDSIRYNSLEQKLQNGFVNGNYVEQSITWGSANQYINCNNGVISDAGAVDAHVSDYIDCSDIQSIRLTASSLYAFACVAFYDVNKTFLRSYPSASSNIDYWMDEIEVPANAKYVVFGNNSGYSGKLAVKIEYLNSYASSLCRKWAGKKWACVGDSLTEINARASMRYMDYIQIATGIKPYNMGKSGTGYANRHSQSEAFIDRIANVPTDSDVVTIFGSFNDVFSSSPLDVGTITDAVSDNTLCGFINGTIDALYNAFPTAQLGIITPCPWENANPNDATSRASQYVKALVDICNSRGIACLDLFHCSGMRPWEESYRNIYYTNDEGNGVHPNALGHKIIASHVNAFLDTILI